MHQAGPRRRRRGVGNGACWGITPRTMVVTRAAEREIGTNEKKTGPARRDSCGSALQWSRPAPMAVSTLLYIPFEIADL